jgi:hypothetical protein
MRHCKIDMLSLLKEVNCVGYNIAISLGTNKDFYENAYEHFRELHGTVYIKYMYDIERILYGNKEKLKIYLGKNCDIMKWLLPTIKGKTVFFLNIDDKEPYLYLRKGDEPFFVDEVNCINQFFKNEAVLFISSWSGFSKHEILRILRDRLVISYLIEDMDNILVIRINEIKN